MEHQFSRTELLIGSENTERLKQARVAVFGIGGVGGYVAEALARSGVGTLDLIDSDRICLSNLNRQIYALHSTIGKYKVDVAKERIQDINPEAHVNVYRIFYLPETASQFDFAKYDYVVDAIDTVTGKLMLIQQAKEAGTPVISAMGAGNKMDPAAFRVADISKTSVCPLAKVMRRELKKRGINHLKVVYSEEKPLTPIQARCSQEEPLLTEDCAAAQNEASSESAAPQSLTKRRQTPGSNAFVPAVAGLILAGEVVKDMLQSWYNPSSKETFPCDFSLSAQTIYGNMC